MQYSIYISKKDLKKVTKMPKLEQVRFKKLVKDLQKAGPIQQSWKNFSELGNSKFHCHITYKWVACWKNIDGNLEIEVYYVGSRENAPY